MESGFAGVEIHGAHGYLLAQYMSAKSNQRTDSYGGSALNRVRIVVEVIEAMRRVVPKSFCIGIKFNSVDHQSESALADCIEQLKAIVAAGVDFLEISGGTYEDPIMMLGTEGAKAQPEKSQRTLNREAFFLDFAKAIRHHFKDVPLMVTGGFRSRKGMEAALRQGDCDIIGLGRPSVVDPFWPKQVILNKEVSDSDAAMFLEPVKIPWLVKKIGGNPLSGGVETNWYANKIRQVFNL